MLECGPHWLDVFVMNLCNCSGKCKCLVVLFSEFSFGCSGEEDGDRERLSEAVQQAVDFSGKASGSM